MNLEDTMLNEINKPRKHKYHLYEVLRVVKLAKTESRPVVARGWRDERVLFTGFRVSVLEDSASTGDRW